jgi:hypothetical protein
LLVWCNTVTNSIEVLGLNVVVREYPSGFSLTGVATWPRPNQIASWSGLFHCGGLSELLDIAPMPKIPPAVRYTLAALLIAVPHIDDVFSI